MRSWLALAAVLVGGVGPPVSVAAQFGRYGTHSGQFDEPFGIAVVKSTGAVYVLDSNNHRIERFSRDGAFVLAWGWGVADGRTQALQVCRRRCLPGLAGSGAGELSFAEDVVVDNDPLSPSYNDLYIADIGNHRVEEFSPDGQFIAMYGRGVNLTNRGRHDAAREDRCPVASHDRCGAGQPGRGRGQFEFPVEGHLLATGSDGSLYVGDRSRIERFSSRGAFMSELALSPRTAGVEGEAGGVSGLAVDARGDLYVIRNAITGVREYGPRGQPLRTFDDKGEPAYVEGPTPVLALDGAGHVFIDEFVDQEHQIREYDQNGCELASFDYGTEDVLHGMTYSSSNHRLYVLNTNGNVRPPRAFVRIVTPPSPSLSLGSSVFGWLFNCVEPKTLSW